MKRLKFYKKYIDPIFNGNKYITLRYNDNQNIKDGDKVQLVNSKTKEVIGNTTVISTRAVTLKRYSQLNPEGHTKYEDWEDLYETMSKFYDLPKSPNTEVKMIVFKPLN